MPALPVIDPPFDHSAAARGLAGAVEGEVRFDTHNRMLYATDASLYQVEPLGVVIPSSIEDAVRAVEHCAGRGYPVLPRGGGTSLAGQCTARAVVIDFSPRCRAILGVDEAGRTARVEPGITVEDLNDALAPRGLFFAPDPATARQANIGGCIGNNAAGARSVMYGRTSENLSAVDAAVLTEGGVRRVRFEKGSRDPLALDLARRVAEVARAHAGLIRQRFPRTVRRNAGYALDMVLAAMDSAGPRADSDAVLGTINLAHLLCGSEGTLAVTLGAEVLLHPVPRARGLALVGFDSLDDAVGAVGPLLATGPSAVELLDDLVLGLARQNTEYRRYAEVMPATGRGAAPAAVLYVEHSAVSAGALGEKMSAVPAALSGVCAGARVKVCTPPETAMAWKLRKAGEPLLHGMPGDRKPITFIEDNVVPPETLPRFVRELRAIVERHGTRASFWAHASVGVLHVRPLLNIRDEQDRRRMHAIAAEAADLARSLGGVMSGEHGDGRARGPLLERHFGPELMRAFRQVKAIFDPRNLLNPGNIVEPGPIESITQRVRVAPRGVEVAGPEVETYFDFGDQHGLLGAAEMCNGAGVCRKKSGGTMCPSYMGTLDERHSTRGRGNALRLAITGQLAEGAARGPEPIWNDPGTIETLRLCLSCKACKAECPSNVDIARLKAEYTAQRHRATGRVPLAARALGSVRTLNRLGALMPGVSNVLGRARPVRAVIDRVLGLAPRRSLPEFSRSLPRVLAGRARAEGGAPAVALFGDCFTMYNESGVGAAASRVLEAFGYRVVLADAGCCGRAMISTGMLGGAIESADAALARLRPLVEDSALRAVLVLEPSCLSALKDDWLQLRLRTPMEARRALAAKSSLVEEFLEREWSRHPKRPEFPAGPEVLLHAHCHQKALWGAETSAAILRRIGARVTVPDAGCCGMAGSFGYMADTYDLSMRIGALTLFPAVRASGDATVVAPGTSCRHQIRDGTGVRALHPVELLDRMIRGLGASLPVAAGVRCG